jgi:ABC-type transport system involved in multi-copper enzyme maturation permease subunit
MIRTIARYSLREAMHNRMAVLLVVLLLAAFLLVEFVGAVALTEHLAIQGALAGGMLRAGSVLVVALFVVTTLLREQQDRTLDLLLALPRPRSEYVLGKLLAYIALAAVIAAACAALLLLYADGLAVLHWGLSLACELTLVAALGLLIAFSIRQPVAALALLGGIYLLARSMNALLLIIRNPVVSTDGPWQGVAAGFIELLAWLLPALHQFTDAGWVAHGTGSWASLALVAGQTAVYLPLLAAAAAFDLHRREF